MNTCAGPVIRYQDVPDSPWRNGRGRTREIRRGDGWRLSIATIAAAGEFSRFPERSTGFSWSPEVSSS